MFQKLDSLEIDYSRLKLNVSDYGLISKNVVVMLNNRSKSFFSQFKLNCPVWSLYKKCLTFIYISEVYGKMFIKRFWYDNLNIFEKLLAQIFFLFSLKNFLVINEKTDFFLDEKSVSYNFHLLEISWEALFHRKSKFSNNIKKCFQVILIGFNIDFGILRVFDCQNSNFSNGKNAYHTIFIHVNFMICNLTQ